MKEVNDLFGDYGLKPAKSLEQDELFLRLKEIIPDALVFHSPDFRFVIPYQCRSGSWYEIDAGTIRFSKTLIFTQDSDAWTNNHLRELLTANDYIDIYCSLISDGKYKNGLAPAEEL